MEARGWFELRLQKDAMVFTNSFRLACRSCSASVSRRHASMELINAVCNVAVCFGQSDNGHVQADSLD